MIIPNDVKEINFNVAYPNSNQYEYFTYLQKLDMDKVREKDLSNGTGFIIENSKGLKKDIKNRTGIYSHLYGSNNIQDTDSFKGRYRCLCGAKRGGIYEDELCKECNTRVKYTDDDMKKTGYLVLKDQYHIIHSALYWELARFIGEGRLERILQQNLEVNSNGIIKPLIMLKKDEPFRGIGMLEFYNRFDEIMEFYKNKNRSKPDSMLYYNDIMANRNILFHHTIAIYTSLLRPAVEDNGSLKYEDCNEEFTMLNILVEKVNDDELTIDRKSKGMLDALWDIQKNINNVYIKIKEILAKKKGDIRSAIGGRFCFSSRSVIRQDVNLKADQIKLPFAGLCELLQQVIINILVKTYGFTFAEAKNKWDNCQRCGHDKVIRDIIEGLINYHNGLPIIINRNPTINFGSILSVKCIGINDDYTMSISLLVLKVLAADFDGDTLNILYLYNKELIEIADKVLSPRQMFISRNDGLCNADFIHSRDVIINANSLKNMYRYSEQQIAKIQRLQNMT